MRSERFEQNLNVLLSEKPEDDLNREWELILQENPETGDYDMLILQIWAALLNQDWETGYQLASIAMKRNRLSLQANFLFAETAFQLGKYEESYDIYRNLFQLQELYKEEVLDMDELQSKLKEIGRYMLQDLSKDIPEKWACIFGDVIQAALDDKDLIIMVSMYMIDKCIILADIITGIKVILLRRIIGHQCWEKVRFTKSFTKAEIFTWM